MGQREPAKVLEVLPDVEAGGFPEKNLRGMEATLERLAEVVAEGRAA